MSQKFTLTINLDNDAFQPEPNDELARILGDIAKKIANGWTEGSAIDINGNKVGHFSVEDDE